MDFINDYSLHSTQEMLNIHQYVIMLELYTQNCFPLMVSLISII